VTIMRYTWGDGFVSARTRFCVLANSNTTINFKVKPTTRSELNEYYPYRTELKLLPQVAKDLNTRFNQPLTVIEFGAGSLKKIEPLLSNVEAIDTFIPIDICGEHLESAAKKLQADYPGINVRAIEADFTQSVALPPTSNARFGFFPGSTIGNFNPEDALEFLTQAGKTLGLGSHLLIGVDTKKSPDILQREY